jgi:hypothetical protein
MELQAVKNELAKHTAMVRIELDTVKKTVSYMEQGFVNMLR